MIYVRYKGKFWSLQSTAPDKTGRYLLVDLKDDSQGIRVKSDVAGYITLASPEDINGIEYFLSKEQ